MINRAKAFDSFKNGPFPGHFTQDQVKGINVIFDEWEHRKLEDNRWLAYMLATAYHETNHFMLPVIETRSVRETINPTVDTAIARLDHAYAAGKMPWVKTIYWRKDNAGHSYLGRGLPQLTHKTNYAKMGELLNVDLVNNPDLALEPEIAVQIMFEGMIRGIFTNHKLADYFNNKFTDYYYARKIINGLERAALVEGYAKQFFNDLNEAEHG